MTAYLLKEPETAACYTFALWTVAFATQTVTDTAIHHGNSVMGVVLIGGDKTLFTTHAGVVLSRLGYFSTHRQGAELLCGKPHDIRHVLWE